MRIQRALAISVGAALVVAAALGDAKNLGDEHNYRIGGDLVPSDQNECAGVPSCLSATLPATSVPGRGRTEKTFACPPSHPNLWNWDAAQHEHVLVKLIDVDQFTVTVEGVNAASTPGDFVVSLGCSPEPYAGTGIQLSRQLAPTSQLQKRKPARSSGKGPRHVLGQVGGDACDNVPDCQLQQQPTFAMGGWATTTKSYACASPYPYAWGFTYTQTGSPSVSAIGANFEESPGTQDILLTNWNPFATDDVTVVVACSKSNMWGGSCGAPQSDPGCPQVPGSAHMYCSKGPVPVCFSTYQERCAPNNELYSCTIDVVIPWCQPCPGQ
jgi:hypothetical protein